MTRTGATARRWFWLRDGLIPAGQAASEAIPLYALVSLLSATAQHKLVIGYVTVAAMMAVPAWAMRLTDLLPRTYHIGRVALAALTAVGLAVWVHLALVPYSGWDPRSMFFVIGQPWLIDPTRNGQMLFAAWFLAICLWSRGLWIGLEVGSAQREARWFIGGMAVLLALAAMLAASPAAQVEPLIGGLRSDILWYFFVGLLVLALVHAGTLRATGGAAPGASFSWLIAAALPIAAITLAGLLFTEGAAPMIRTVMRVALTTGIMAWQVLLWIGYWLLLFLRWLASLFPAGAGGTLHGRPGVSRPPPPVRLLELQQHLSMSSFDATVVLVIAIFGVLAGLLLYVLTRQRTIADAPAADDERSFVWSWALFLSQMRDLWASLLDWWRTGRVLIAPPVVTTPDTEVAGAGADIRALYRRFLWLAARMHHPRPPTATPVEFGRSFARAVPGRSGEIGIVTDAYDRARYGLEPFSPDGMAAVQGALARLEEVNSSQDPGH